MLFNINTELKQREALFNATGYKTMKAAKEDPRFIKSFMNHGNKKLRDYNIDKDGKAENPLIENCFANFRYAQFNLMAKTTCPYATDDCKKFCYAKRDERYPNVIENRKASFEASQDPEFINNMIFTIKCHMYSRRFYGSVMVIRIHESGDFYCQEYLDKWLDIINAFIGCPVIFQFYTKCFRYIINLDYTRSGILAAALNSHNIGLSLSIDNSSSPIAMLQAETIRNTYNNVNIYRVKNADQETQADHICDCEHCARCGHCTITTGENNEVVVH